MKIKVEVEIKLYALSWVDKHTHGSRPIAYFTNYKKAILYLNSVARFWGTKREALEIEEFKTDPEPLRFD